MDFDGLDSTGQLCSILRQRKPHVNGTSQYSANIVATMLMTISLYRQSVSLRQITTHSLVLSVAVVSTKMFFVLPATILESSMSSFHRLANGGELTLGVDDRWHGQNSVFAIIDDGVRWGVFDNVEVSAQMSILLRKSASLVHFDPRYVNCMTRHFLFVVHNSPRRYPSTPPQCSRHPCSTART